MRGSKRAWIAVALMLLAILACGSTSDGSPTAQPQAAQEDAAGEEATPTEAAAPEPTEAAAPTGPGAVGEPQQGSGYELTVVSAETGVTEIPGDLPMTAEEGKAYAIAELLITNTGSEPVAYNLFYVKLKDAAGFEYTISAFGRQPMFQSGELSPGDVVRGFVTFEVPADATGLVLEYVPISFGDEQRIRVRLTE